MNTSALLGNLLNTKADYTYIMQQQIFWNSKYEANQQKLTKQVNADEKWHSKYDDAMNNDKKITFQGKEICDGSGSSINPFLASEYAQAQVRNYNSSLSEELSALDIEYDSMKTMFDTQLEVLKAQQDAEKTTVQTAAQDTGLLAQ